MPEAGINVFGLLRQIADLSADFLFNLCVPLSDFELAVIFIDVGGCVSVCAFAAFVVLLFFWRLLKIFSPLVLLIVVITLTVILLEKLFCQILDGLILGGNLCLAGDIAVIPRGF